MRIFVVAIPWDSARIDRVVCFKTQELAQEFADRINQEGYHGYTGGICVEECYVYTRRMK